MGPALTGTVTGNYNGTNSGNSLTFTQAENRVTKLEAGVSDPNTSTVFFGILVNQSQHQVELQQ